MNHVGFVEKLQINSKIVIPKINKLLKKLGPGLLFAGAAIGVSHLVQSTRAGAEFGMGLLWALILVNIFKYPFFQYGPRYASATGESLLDGYYKLGRGILIAYAIITLATMFTIQTAVTIVTAGLAASLTNGLFSTEVWTIIIIIICSIVLFFGKYKLLDKLIKYVIILLAISTIFATLMAFNNNTNEIILSQFLPEITVEIAFLIAFMGWMPAPLDVSVWHSLWSLEKQKTNKNFTYKSSLFDFNVGYIGTVILGVAFMSLGYLVMFGGDISFSTSASLFSNQLIEMYTSSLGEWSYYIIGIAAFTTMLSTTITTLDASPRSMNRTTKLLINKDFKHGYLFWLVILSVGTIFIFFLFSSKMGLLIKIATILSFLTAPFYAIINYILISSEHTPKEYRPSIKLHILSILGIIFLIGFSLWFLVKGI
ncbi:MAG: divalent metal cation transporter [Flavobacteriaceae bacterium]|nr:divalent metal cation transporter [Flavobacteriaceae bacterium]MBT4113872.1 divalent metal cation transporter [Flavobacteriaceae bacterium]MBT4613769.1 divalent metal cation transporter [Flavobacteriaceae bacterium]MBT5246349.1 divalent metal cation transporter [Flavobacteriaceae bacterium]MBT5650402.1 divalent metal cation transporter [Flavobacteriaceae bacterium]